MLTWLNKPPSLDIATRSQRGYTSQGRRYFQHSFVREQSLLGIRIFLGSRAKPFAAYMIFRVNRASTNALLHATARFVCIVGPTSKQTCCGM